MARPTLLLVLLTSVLVSCDGGPRSEPLELQGERAFSYTAYAEDGSRLLEGTIILHPRYSRLDFSEEVRGEWEIRWVPGADQNELVGPQVGRGTLEGIATEEGFGFNMNPTFADNNVLLVGTVHNGDLSGEWSHNTIAGPVAGGAFTARE